MFAQKPMDVSIEILMCLFPSQFVYLLASHCATVRIKAMTEMMIATHERIASGCFKRR